MRIWPMAGRQLALLMVLEVLFGAVAAGVLGADAVSAATDRERHVKVVIIVGPVGALTSSYRALGEEAAAAARKRSDDVVTIYSPNATWPVVRRALAGASIVVYLGHGNGWPSPYRDALYGRTQNGLGLNPVAGVDNEAHQYFGERYLADKVRLAPGAVVVLGHLCYASGNPEPGGPDPTLHVAQQRADNYAAGWMAAGATAVIAEGHGRPSYYVTALLKARGTIERMWRAAPTFHDHVIEMPSSRTPGTTVMLDPDRRSRGYFRSLAVVPGTRIASSLAGAPPVPTVRPDPPEPASPAVRGARFGAPALDGRPVAGTDATLKLAADKATLTLLPEDASIGARWDPLIPVAPVLPMLRDAASPSAEAPPASPSASPDPTAGPDAELGSGGGASRGALATEPVLDSDDPPSIDLIGPETLGAVVSVASAKRMTDGLAVPITMPDEPGLYRLVTTVHDAEGVAFDAATQALIPALLVRVTASMSAAYAAPAALHPDPGETFSVRVRIANTGTDTWRQPAPLDPVLGQRVPDDGEPLLVARWIGLDEIVPSGRPPSAAVLAADIRPGFETVLQFDLVAPPRPGLYLLMFDIRMADGRSFASMGIPPGITSVVVGRPEHPQERRPRARGSKGAG
jgi:hypothetical protein